MKVGPHFYVETTFSKTLSTTYWPTDAYLAILLSVLREDESFTKDFNYCDNPKSTPASELERFRYNFLQVKVYFEDLNYESITEEPMYERVRFLSDIGGAMGLFLGASVISFVEVVQLLLELFLLIKEKHLDKRKARVLPHNYKT